MPEFRRVDFINYYRLDKNFLYVALDDNYYFKNPCAIQNQELYLDLNFVLKNISPNLYLDALLAQTYKPIILNLDEFDQNMHAQENILSSKIITRDQKKYISSEFIRKLCDLELKINLTHQLVNINTHARSHTQAKIKSNALLKIKPYKKSFVLDKLKAGSLVKIYDEPELRGYVKIKTNLGLIGYVNSKSICDIKIDKPNLDRQGHKILIMP